MPDFGKTILVVFVVIVVLAILIYASTMIAFWISINKMCGDDSECPKDKKCWHMTCVPACENDSDCSEGVICNGRGSCGGTCKSNTDCPDNMFCDVSDGICYNLPSN